MGLLDADWLSEGSIRLNETLSLRDLSACWVLNHARLVMEHMAANQGVKLTTTGNFNRKFVEQMVRDFRWPGFEPDVVWRYSKVLNEPDSSQLLWPTTRGPCRSRARKAVGSGDGAFPGEEAAAYRSFVVQTPKIRCAVTPTRLGAGPIPFRRPPLSGRDIFLEAKGRGVWQKPNQAADTAGG